MCRLNTRGQRMKYFRLRSPRKERCTFVPGYVDVLLISRKIHWAKERPMRRPALSIKNGIHRSVCSLRHHEDASKDSDVHCSGLAARQCVVGGGGSEARSERLSITLSAPELTHISGLGER